MFTLRTLFTVELGSRARARQLKTESIIEAAARMVAEGGLEALTIHRLAKELGCAVGGLYRYFPSMSSLHAELQCRIIREYDDALTRHLARLPARTNQLTRIQEIARHYQQWFLARPGKLGLLAVSMSDPRRLLTDEENARVMAELGRVLGHLIEAFDRAAEKGDLSKGSGALRALAFWSGILGVLDMRKMDRWAPQERDAPNRALLDEVARAMLLGWGAKPQRLKKRGPR
jgi:AcrR family transcriptional regulator